MEVKGMLGQLESEKPWGQDWPRHLLGTVAGSFVTFYQYLYLYRIKPETTVAEQRWITEYADRIRRHLDSFRDEYLGNPQYPGLQDELMILSQRHMWKLNELCDSQHVDRGIIYVSNNCGEIYEKLGDEGLREYVFWVVAWGAEGLADLKYQAAFR
ncbi:hypothetical protein A2154_03865 [Candidatus Gottesmanbacteria bacterium RBG_16_43_7]|uniref:Uncharacterized protein n=1 Tax=Candidatus Gottesmanbacteria bacterium RBG_16_43_7 TaxID=1798373 RepID=A0A1F5Z8V1_9BACT|nr:MAG: hypothetical protein A2154_03865 [Candidatus Gottesmanbacteria bacterium RBG_16_43_7]